MFKIFCYCSSILFLFALNLKKVLEILKGPAQSILFKENQITLKVFLKENLQKYVANEISSIVLQKASAEAQLITLPIQSYIDTAAGESDLVILLEGDLYEPKRRVISPLGTSLGGAGEMRAVSYITKFQCLSTCLFMRIPIGATIVPPLLPMLEQIPMFKTYQLNDLEQIASNATRNLFFKNEWVPMPEIKRGTKCIFVVFSGNFGVFERVLFVGSDSNFVTPVKALKKIKEISAIDAVISELVQPIKLKCTSLQGEVCILFLNNSKQRVKQRYLSTIIPDSCINDENSLHSDEQSITQVSTNLGPSVIVNQDISNDKKNVSLESEDDYQTKKVAFQRELSQNEMNSGKKSVVTNQQLKWLPISYRIDYLKAQRFANSKKFFESFNPRYLSTNPAEVIQKCKEKVIQASQEKSSVQQEEVFQEISSQVKNSLSKMLCNKLQQKISRLANIEKERNYHRANQNIHSHFKDFQRNLIDSQQISLRSSSSRINLTQSLSPSSPRLRERNRISQIRQQRQQPYHVNQPPIQESNKLPLSPLSYLFPPKLTSNKVSSSLTNDSSEQIDISPIQTKLSEQRIQIPFVLCNHRKTMSKEYIQPKERIDSNNNNFSILNQLTNRSLIQSNKYNPLKVPTNSMLRNQRTNKSPLSVSTSNKHQISLSLSSISSSRMKQNSQE